MRPFKDAITGTFLFSFHTCLTELRWVMQIERNNNRHTRLEIKHSSLFTESFLMGVCVRCHAEPQNKASVRCTGSPPQALVGLEWRLNAASPRELLEYSYESSSFTPAWAESTSVLNCRSTHPHIYWHDVAETAKGSCQLYNMAYLD